jgi:hypothetical protein
MQARYSTKLFFITVAIVAVCLLSCTTVLAQHRRPPIVEDTREPSNYFIGGSLSFGLGLGTASSFSAGIHPYVGYTLASWVDAGVGLNFEYYSAKDLYSNKLHNTIYGGGVFSRFYPFQQIFIQLQPEYNNTNVKFIPSSGGSYKYNTGCGSLLIGAGYINGRKNKNTFSYISVLFDIFDNPNSPYVSANRQIMPIIRAGFNIGFKKKK